LPGARGQLRSALYGQQHLLACQICAQCQCINLELCDLQRNRQFWQGKGRAGGGIVQRMARLRRPAKRHALRRKLGYVQPPRDQRGAVPIQHDALHLQPWTRSIADAQQVDFGAPAKRTAKPLDFHLPPGI